MMKCLILLGFVYAVHSAAIEPHVITVESSQEKGEEEGRFIFAATITETLTSFTTTVLSTIVNQQYCYTTYSTKTLLDECRTVSTIAGRRKKRDNAAALVETLPEGMRMYMNGVAVDFNSFVESRKKALGINPTPRHAKSAETKKLEFHRMEVVGGADNCFAPQSYGRMAERAEPRFVTFRTTSTLMTATTSFAQSTNAVFESVAFDDLIVATFQKPKSHASTKDAANGGGCFPKSLLESISVLACG